MSIFNEAATVQEWLVRKLAGQGWAEIKQVDLDRRNTDVFVSTELIAALTRLNPEITVDPDLVNEIMPIINLAANTVGTDLLQANEEMTAWLRGRKTHRFSGTDREVPIRLIDFQDPTNNSYWVTSELTYGPAGKNRRFDVVLWINGIPLVVIETKTPARASVSWLNGALDLTGTYVPELPRFFVPNLMLAATEGKEFHYGTIGSEPSNWQMWGSTADPYDLDGMERVERTVELLLTPESILELLGSFTYFHADESASYKILPRYPQVEAAKAIHQKIRDGGTKGLIWHFQGTGKTLLMAFAANLILEDPDIGDPTVLIVLDRKDLISQTMRQFRSLGGAAVNLMEATTRAELRDTLVADRTGVIVTSIFRFAEVEEALSERENIIVLIDEAHRTQEGDLGTYMRTALPNARFFGLTGTPIADASRNTFELFSDPDDPEPALSEYSMERSIHDGASVPVHVEPRLITWQLDSVTMDAEFDALATTENLSEDQRDMLIRKAGKASSIVRNPDRIAAVCRDILEHYSSKVAPLGLKAQVVAFDRELVVAYEEELNRLIELTPAYNNYTTQVVMTTGSKEDPPEWREKYELSRHEQEKIVRDFKSHEGGPHLLIVTAKLLTGFDAPIEGAMYLDKPLTKHTLFQAITRTNRRYRSPVTNQDKHYGLIVDYIGLGSAIAAALKKADPDGQGSRPVDIEGLIAEFELRMEQALVPFADISRTAKFESMMAAQKILREDDELAEQFAADYIGLQTIWELVSPHPDLADLEDDYLWLAGIYESLQPTKTGDALLWLRLGAKTQQIVFDNMHEMSVTGQREQVVIDAESIDALRALAEEPGGDSPEAPELAPITVTEAFETIQRRLARLAESSDAALYKDLSEQISKLHKEAIASASDNLLFLKRAIEIARKATKLDKHLVDENGDETDRILDPNIGALTQIFEQNKPDGISIVIEDVVAEIDRIVREVSYSGWAKDQAGDREVRKQLRLILDKYALPITGGLYDEAYSYIRENY